MAVGAGVPLVVTIGVVAFSRSSLHAEGAHGDLPSISKIIGGSAAAAVAPAPASLASLDLTKITVGETSVTAPLAEKKIAHLTVDPALQRIAEGVMAMHHVPEAAVVLMDTATGKILVYASHVEKGPARDLCVEATAPAASVFKIITASALVEQTGATADQRECYSGGEQRIVEKDLVPDPKRDRWCTTLGGAMGRSLNTVFAREALEHLKPAGLESMAKQLGFGAALPFDVAVQPSAEHFPEDSLGFARTAAGFWNTTLSPVHAAWLSATMGRGGEPIRPVLVADVADEEGKVLWTAPNSLAQKRAIKQTTAEAVTSMMETTVSDGTSYRAFHDPKGAAFLPNIGVAGKTGTLTDPTAQRFYTWFTGFAPSRPITIADGDKPDSKPPRQVSIGVLVVNQPTWTIKANVLAREVLRAYFAAQKVQSVTTPQLRQTSKADKSESEGDGEVTPAPGMGAQPSTTPGTKHRRHRGS
jgi:peptidoglycan glycosyltransferase